MASQSEPLLGTADIAEPEVREWVLLENRARELFARYGYGELRTPVIERTDVFVRGLGDETDVVKKEMYTFEDRGGRSVTLRPEGTAGVMRAIANQGLAEGEERRVFYLGPMFRGERPAAGRRRQFHQVGVEAVGRASPLLDAECIAMLLHFLESVGIPDGELLLNTRGSAEDRPVAAAALKEYFAPRLAGLCEDCRRRFETNVWRMLDCKVEGCQETILGAPAVTNLLGPESTAYFAAVRRCLDSLGVRYRVEPRLVRGLDYYEHTVFEVVHGGLGAQNALAGGGRYALYLPGNDRPLRGVGFAAGLERLLLARASLGQAAAEAAGMDAYLVSLGERALAASQALAMELRRAGLRVLADTAGRSMKAQMRSADKARSRFTLIRGDTELDGGTVQCKDMAAGTQEAVPAAAVTAWLQSRLRPGGTE
ncbi:MAG: histidine--tRNA ligase [Lentisphaeria bacterium]